MANSVAGFLPTIRVTQEIFPNTLPSELYKFIFEHSNVVSLMHLSATCQILRLQVHNFFTSRLSDQAKDFPEIRESLASLGWTKEDHDHWACDCFKLVAGPGFMWRSLNKRKYFSTVCGFFGAREYILNDYENCTTVAGKTFFLTPAKEVIFFETSNSATMPNSPRTLVSFKSSPVVIRALSSYDQVLAFSLKKPAPNPRHAICIYNPTTLNHVAEIDLIAYASEIPQDVRFVRASSIAFAKNTMAIHLAWTDYGSRWISRILLWKINTQEPQEEGISFLSKIAPTLSATFWFNDRFIAILEPNRTSVLRRSDGAFVCQIGRRAPLWVLEKGQGDNIALAYYEGLPLRQVFQIFSITQGRNIIQKEFVDQPFPSVRYMNWFGPHLVIVLQRGQDLSVMSWQLGLSSFVTCPLNIPVVRRSSRGNGRVAVNWAADCVHVDYEGITVALNKGLGETKNHVWRYQ